jgi:hypothetical protein
VFGRRQTQSRVNSKKLAVLAAFAGLLAAGPVSPPPLLVASPYGLIYVEGAKRQGASAGAGTSEYRLLGTMPGGGVLVSYRDNGTMAVEEITPQLEPRKVKTLTRGASFVGPASDGFVVYDASAQLLRRYDTRGNLSGAPAAAIGGPRDALGIGDATIAIGSGRMWSWDRGGRLRHETLIDAGALVALPGDRFAVTDDRYGEVRVYTTSFDLVTTLRFAGRKVSTIAAGSDGALAIMIGTPSCSLSDAEIDVYDSATSPQPRARIREHVGATIALAIDGNNVYAVNTACRAGDDATITIFARDGTPREVLPNVGRPTGVIPFPSASRTT